VVYCADTLDLGTGVLKEVGTRRYILSGNLAPTFYATARKSAHVHHEKRVTSTTLEAWKSVIERAGHVLPSV
jgi:hypothetical protein